jgi:hypothetical protein
MIIRQEESTPIGDQFHDSSILKVVEKLSNIVDEFELDTDDVQTYCDNLITSLKSLKAITKKAEAEYQKVKAQRELKSSLNTYN